MTGLCLGIRFTIQVSNKWAWVFGILTAATFVLAAVFFAATQQLTGRDWVVLVIGALAGATVTSLIATFVFHANSHTQALAAAKVASRELAEAEISRLDAESRARVEAEERAAAAEDTRREKVAAAQSAHWEKQTALLTSLPTRRESLTEMKDEIAQLRINSADADGRYKAGMSSARDAAAHGYNDIAYQSQATAKTWEIAKLRFDEKLLEREADHSRLATMTDEEYLDEQKNLRGLG